MNELNTLLKGLIKNKKGESLVETVISITLFTIYSATIFGIISTALEFNETAAKESEHFQEDILPVAEMKTYSADGGDVTFEIIDPVTGMPIATTSEPVYMLDETQGEGYVAFSPEVNANVE